MLRLRILILLVIGFAVCAAETGTRSILFIGNSLTYKNDLPKVLAGLAKAGGQGELLCEGVLVGGATLKKHWDDGKALEKLQSRSWTWVVVQENSAGTTKSPEEFFDYGRKFIDAIKVRQAKPVLYLTWPHLGEMESLTLIAKAYRKLGAETGALVVPAGMAFDVYRKQHGDASLLTDNRHPTPAGTYLAASCFYGVLFAKDPAGLPGGTVGLDATLAGELQRLAWDAVRKEAAQQNADAASR